MIHVGVPRRPVVIASLQQAKHSRGRSDRDGAEVVHMRDASRILSDLET
jgi:hypothetical protein